MVELMGKLTYTWCFMRSESARSILRHALAAMTLAALAARCGGGNGPPATITPDPTNPMNPMGYRVVSAADSGGSIVSQRKELVSVVR